RGIHRILKDVGQLAGNFREQREAIRAGGPGQRVRRDVQALDVIGLRIGVLQDAGVFPQELQVLRCFLKKDLYEFSAVFVQALSWATAARRDPSGFWYSRESRYTCVSNVTSALAVDSACPRNRY